MDTSFWAATDPGRVREVNEDNYLVDKSLGLFVVCDGMGGHAAGEVASSAAARILRDVMAANRQVVERCRRQPSSTHRQDVLTLLEFAVRDACARIHRMAANDAGRRGMGTTLTALLVCGQRGFLAHVGDSRLYLLRHDQIHQLTEDHSLVNELLKRGRLTEEEVAELPIKNAVTRAVGVYETVDVDTHNFDVLPEDRFLLCSDGLHNYLPDEPPLRRLLTVRNPALIPQRAIDFANRCGGKDNITAILIEVGADAAYTEHSAQFRVGMATLRELPLMRALSYREVSAVMDVMQRRTVRPGERIEVGAAAGRSPSMCIVLGGTVVVRRHKHVLGRVETPGWFGMRGVMGAPPERGLEYVAHDEVHLLELRGDDLRELLTRDAELATGVLWNAAQLLAMAAPVEALELDLAARGRSLDMVALGVPSLDSADFQIIGSEAAGATSPSAGQTTASFEMDDLTHEVELIDTTAPIDSGEFLDPDELVEEIEEIEDIDGVVEIDELPQTARDPHREGAGAAAGFATRGPAGPQSTQVTRASSQAFEARTAGRVRRPRSEPMTPLNRARVEPTRQATDDSVPFKQIHRPDPVGRTAAPTGRGRATTPAGARQQQQQQQQQAQQQPGGRASEYFARLRSMIEPADEPAARRPPRHDEQASRDTVAGQGQPVHDETVRMVSPWAGKDGDDDHNDGA